MTEGEAGGLSGGRERCEQGRWQEAAWCGSIWIRTIDGKRKKELKLQQTFAATCSSKNYCFPSESTPRAEQGGYLMQPILHVLKKPRCIWNYNFAWPQFLNKCWREFWENMPKVSVFFSYYGACSSGLSGDTVERFKWASKPLFSKQICALNTELKMQPKPYQTLHLNAPNPFRGVLTCGRGNLSAARISQKLTQTNKCFKQQLVTSLKIISQCQALTDSCHDPACLTSPWGAWLSDSRRATAFRKTLDPYNVLGCRSATDSDLWGKIRSSIGDSMWIF